MRHIYKTWGVLTFFFFVSFPVVGQPPPTKYISGKLFVQTTAPDNLRSAPNEVPADILRLQNKYGITALQPATNLPELSGLYELTFTDTVFTEKLLRELTQLPSVQYAERIPLYETFLTPNDLHSN